MKQFKLKNGITLIALIITIIILLILAMVTINILINQGIIGHAQNAVETYDEKQVKEDIALAYDEYKMQKFGANAKSLYDFFKDKYGADHVTDNGDGSITVSVTSNGKTYTVKLKEDGSMESMTGLSLNKSKITLEYEEGTPATDTIKATLTDVSGNVTWSIADNSIATINETTGNQVTVTSVKEGSTTITAECGKYTKTCEVNVYLKLPIGEYINYDCFTGVDSSKLYYKSPKEKNGSSDQELQVTENPKWKILGRDDSGKILITTANSMLTKTGNKYILKGKPGYVNGPNELDKIAKLYSNGAHAIQGRSITVDDINKIQNYKPSAPVFYAYTMGEDGYVYRNGEKTNKTCCYYYKSNPEGEWEKLKEGETIQIGDQYYYYRIKSQYEKLLSYEDDGTSGASYWLASRMVRSDVGTGNTPSYYVISVSKWDMNNNGASTYNSNDTSNWNSRGIRPVVTLSSDVTIGEKVDDVWQIVQK